MKLISIDLTPGYRTGVLVGDEALDFALAGDLLPLANWVPSDMRILLAGGPGALDIIRGFVSAVADDAMLAQGLRRVGALKPISAIRLGPPVPRPGILLSHGRAYHDHLKEMRGADAKPSEDPSGFLKNTNSITASGSAIRLPPHRATMVDFEGEFSIVFGSRCHHVSEVEALDFVVGYTIINDVSARDWVPHFRQTGNPDLNRAGKQFPTFTPMGPCIVTKDEIPDPHALTLITTLNGQIMQDAHTSGLIWRIPALISYFSEFYCFEPGDILTTGSPSGVGFGRKPPVFMRAGDIVEVTVSSVGSLINTIVAG